MCCCGLNNHKSSLVQVIDWHLTNDKPLPKPMMTLFTYAYIDGFVQDCGNSIANALELLQSCTKSLIFVDILLASESSVQS